MNNPQIVISLEEYEKLKVFQENLEKLISGDINGFKYKEYVRREYYTTLIINDVISTDDVSEMLNKNEDLQNKLGRANVELINLNSDKVDLNNELYTIKSKPLYKLLHKLNLL